MPHRLQHQHQEAMLAYRDQSDAWGSSSWWQTTHTAASVGVSQQPAATTTTAGRTPNSLAGKWFSWNRTAFICSSPTKQAVQTDHTTQTTTRVTSIHTLHALSKRGCAATLRLQAHHLITRHAHANTPSSSGHWSAVRHKTPHHKQSTQQTSSLQQQSRT